MILPETDESSPVLSLILPTYNERENIIILLEKLQEILPMPFEAIVVDDDSPDQTRQEVETFAETHTSVRLLRRCDERGLASALNSGRKMARGSLNL